MKITKRIHNSRHALKHLALAAALGIGLGTGTATADTTITTGQTVTVNNDAGAWAAGAGIVTIDNGGTLYFDPTQGNYTLANDFIFAGSGGNINLTFKGNDTDYKLTGSLTSSATGAQTLAVITGNNNNGDRESVTFDSGIPNVGDSSALGLHVTFNTQSGSDSWVNLNAVNTFTGPITLTKGSNLQHGYLTIGGTITHFSGNSNGSGTLNSGNFPGAISLDPTTFFNYASTAAQTLSGVISGSGAVQVTGGGTLTLSGTNTYSSDTTVSNGSLVLADGGALKFAVTNTSSNKVTGAGSATLDGAFTIDTSAVTAENGSWTLVNTTTKSFGSTFTMPGFSKSGTVFTKVDGTRTWTFDTTSAVLSLSSAGTIMTFGIPGAAGAIDNSALTIHLYVAADTDLATLAPTFTLSSGSCNQTSGAPPSPTFAAANPVHYIITDGSITNDYSVTVSASPLPMTGLTVWLKADAVVASDAAQVDGSGNVLQWNDSSGNSNNAAKGSDQPAPTYVAGVLNGQPVLHFAQAGDNSGGRLYLGDLSASFPSEATIFAVGTVDNDNMYSMFGNSANDERWMGGNWHEVTPGAFRGGRANFSSQYSQMPSTGSHIFAYESSSTAYNFLLDGALIGSTSGDYNNGSGRSWQIGDNSCGNGAQLNGDIAEVILYNRILTTAEASAVGMYLSTKYALTTEYIPALMKTFGIPNHVGVINQSTKTIALSVPYGTDLATLAPTFTLSSGGCNQISGSPPSPTFAAANPVTYTITDGTTVNNYAVTITTLSQPATAMINLGPQDAGTHLGSVDWIAAGTLPVGSILRSVSINDRLDDDLGAGSWASDLNVAVEGQLQIGSDGGNPDWANGQDGTGGTCVDTKVAGVDFPDNIDLHNAKLYLFCAYGEGMYSGTVTITYDQPAAVVSGNTYAGWATNHVDGQAANLDFNNDGVQNGIAYFMGETGAVTLPGIDANNKIAWKHDATATGITYNVLTSPDLAVWTDVTADAVDADGKLTYTLPPSSPGAPKLFVRLAVQEAPVR